MGVPVKIYVWDGVVRACHALLIIGVISAFTSYQLDLMEWHMWNGYMLLATVFVRIIWGFTGPVNARFAHFIKSPLVVWNYIRTWRAQAVGTTHNPLGGYAVLALLGALLLQAGTGLFSTDDILVEGPLYAYVSSAIGDIATGIHENAFWFLLLPLVGVHITAVITYRLVKKVDLVTPMVTGYKNTNS
jgi:cytochrome b